MFGKENKNENKVSHCFHCFPTAGMDFAYASWGSFFPRERDEPDYYLDHPTDLIPFLG